MINKRNHCSIMNKHCDFCAKNKLSSIRIFLIVTSAPSVFYSRHQKYFFVKSSAYLKAFMQKIHRSFSPLILANEVKQPLCDSWNLCLIVFLVGGYVGITGTWRHCSRCHFALSALAHQCALSYYATFSCPLFPGVTMKDNPSKGHPILMLLSKILLVANCLYFEFIQVRVEFPEIRERTGWTWNIYWSNMGLGANSTQR